MRQYWNLKWLLVLLLFLCPSAAEAQQMNFYAGTPDISQYPQVIIPVAVGFNGLPVTGLSVANFSVTEDGQPVSNLTLNNCHGGAGAAIALVIDTSVSMDASLSSGDRNNRYFGAFNNSVSQFLFGLPAQTDVALVPYANTATYSYPGAPKYFFKSDVAADTTLLVNIVQNFTYDGAGTDVNAGVVFAAKLLQRSAASTRAIVLVTDDHLTSTDSMVQALNALNISLYVMEVSRDPRETIDNIYVANLTGGKYYPAHDTSKYTPVMQQIAKDIFTEHCMLSYVSTLPCPWLAQHQVHATVTYMQTNLSNDQTYTLGKNTSDRTPPVYTVDSSIYTSRVITSSDPYPCESGLLLLVDSGLVNFERFRLVQYRKNTARDSIAVIDSMQPASGYYIAIDSAGNRTRIRLSYRPKADINPPQMPSAQRFGDTYTFVIEEWLPWDRGIQNIKLSAGAKNLILDSVKYLSHTYANAYVRIINMKDTSSGCLEATDSVGNKNSQCLQWFGTGRDNTPPAFVQDPIAVPRIEMTGRVTELQPEDIGLKNVSVTPLINSKVPALNFVSRSLANVRAAITDSLYSARAEVTASDSTGNNLRDTLRYDPLADLQPPVLKLVSAGAPIAVTATDIQAWDRGIKSIGASSLVNMTVLTAYFFTAPRADSASLTLQITDPRFNSSATIDAADSTGHVSHLSISFVGKPQIPLLPLTILTRLDFGAVLAPASVLKSIRVTNPNDVPVTFRLSTLLGDDSVFDYPSAKTVTIGAKTDALLSFRFHPSLLGNWKLDYKLANDTMTLGVIQLTGSSYGALTMTLDTVFVPKPGMTADLHLTVRAQPAPINLDTIAFQLDYDPDVITMGSMSTTANNPGLDSSLGNYELSWYSTKEGARIGLLHRKDRTKVTVMDGRNTVIAIPCTGFVSKHDSTAIMLTPFFISQSSLATSKDGLASVGDQCGSPTIRHALNNELQMALDWVSPNPASDHLTAKLHLGMDDLIYYSISRLDGVELEGETVVLHRGENSLNIALSIVPSGSYLLTFRGSQGNSCSRMFSVIK